MPVAINRWCGSSELIRGDGNTDDLETTLAMSEVVPTYLL